MRHGHADAQAGMSPHVSRSRGGDRREPLGFSPDPAPPWLQVGGSCLCTRRFPSSCTTHLDCGSETARNPSRSWSRSWSWSWTGSTGQTSPATTGTGGTVGEETRRLFQSEGNEQATNASGLHRVSAQTPTPKLAEAPDPGTPCLRHTRAGLHGWPSSRLPPQPRDAG